MKNKFLLILLMLGMIFSLINAKAQAATTFYYTSQKIDENIIHKTEADCRGVAVDIYDLSYKDKTKVKVKCGECSEETTISVNLPKILTTNVYFWDKIVYCEKCDSVIDKNSINNLADKYYKAVSAGNHQVLISNNFLGKFDNTKGLLYSNGNTNILYGFNEDVLLCKMKLVNRTSDLDNEYGDYYEIEEIVSNSEDIFDGENGIFFTCKTCSGCNECGKNVGVCSDVSTSTIDKKLLSNYCVDDTCGFFWQVNITGSGSENDAYETLDCLGKAAGNSIFCSMHKCNNLECLRPITGCSLRGGLAPDTDDEQRVLYVYNGADAGLYSNFCTLHACNAYKCRNGVQTLDLSGYANYYCDLHFKSCIIVLDNGLLCGNTITDVNKRVCELHKDVDINATLTECSICSNFVEQCDIRMNAYLNYNICIYCILENINGADFYIYGFDGPQTVIPAGTLKLDGAEVIAGGDKIEEEETSVDSTEEDSNSGDGIFADVSDEETPTEDTNSGSERNKLLTWLFGDQTNIDGNTTLSTMQCANCQNGKHDQCTNTKNDSWTTEHTCWYECCCGKRQLAREHIDEKSPFGKCDRCKIEVEVKEGNYYCNKCGKETKWEKDTKTDELRCTSCSTKWEDNVQTSSENNVISEFFSKLFGIGYKKCTNKACDQYDEKVKVTTKEIDGKEHNFCPTCKVCVDSGCTKKLEEKKTTGGGNGTGGSNNGSSSTPSTDSTPCQHNYPVPNTVVFTNINDEIHLQMWNCSNCNSSQATQYNHFYIGGKCVCEQKADSEAPEIEIVKPEDIKNLDGGEEVVIKLTDNKALKSITYKCFWTEDKDTKTDELGGETSKEITLEKLPEEEGAYDLYIIELVDEAGNMIEDRTYTFEVTGKEKTEDEEGTGEEEVTDDTELPKAELVSPKNMSEIKEDTKIVIKFSDNKGLDRLEYTFKQVTDEIEYVSNEIIKFRGAKEKEQYFTTIEKGTTEISIELKAYDKAGLFIEGKYVINISEKGAIEITKEGDIDSYVDKSEDEEIKTDESED